MRASRILTFLAAAACASCGSPDPIFIVSFGDDSLPADGSSSTLITGRAEFLGRPVEDGTRFVLKVSGGTFEEGKSVKEIEVSTTAGSAEIEWWAPVEVGDYTLSASWTDDYDRLQQASDTISIVDPPPIRGVSFSLSCDANNIATPQSGETEFKLKCSVAATDDESNTVAVSNHRFGFMAEVGRFEIDDNGQLFYIIGPNQTPTDVQPEGGATDGEPRWVQGGKTRNPRDGVATLVVHTSGLPTGTQDALQGEPYVDANDNGIYDVGEDFRDVDENGAYSPPAASGGAVRIWRWFKLLLTGPVDAAAPNQAGLKLWNTQDGSLVVDIPFQSQKSLSVLLVDANLNPVASHPPAGSQDTIEIGTSNGKAVVSPKVPLARDATGMVFNPTTGALDGRATRTAYLQGAELDYTFTITNTLNNATAPESWAIDEVFIKRTGQPGGRTLNETLPVAAAPGGQLMHQ